MAVDAFFSHIFRALGLEIKQPEFTDLVERLPGPLLERLALKVKHEVEARKEAGQMPERMIPFIHRGSGSAH